MIDDRQGQYDLLKRWVAVRNDSTEAAAFSLLKPTGVTSDGIITVTQPDADDLVSLLVNGPGAISAGGYGVASNEFPEWVAYETSDGTPAVGEKWGSGSGSFKLRKDNIGFIVVGGAANGRVLVNKDDRTASGGGSGETGGIVVSGAKASLTAPESISDATPMDVPFDAAGTDTAYFWSGGAPTRLTVPTALGGLYYVGGAYLVWDSNATGYRVATIKKNGSITVVSDKRNAVNGTGTEYTIYFDLENFSAADYLTLNVEQNSGGNLNLVQANLWLRAVGN